MKRALVLVLALAGEAVLVLARLLRSWSWQQTAAERSAAHSHHRRPAVPAALGYTVLLLSFGKRPKLPRSPLFLRTHALGH